jgi:hypothetical protein
MMSKKLALSLVVAFGVIVTSVAMLANAAAPAAAQGRWGHGVGMMGPWGPGRSYTKAYSDTLPYGTGGCGFGAMGMMHGGMMGRWVPWGGDTGDDGGTQPYGAGGCGSEPMGMMGGWGNGGGCPMAGGWNGVDPDATPLTMNQARANVLKFLVTFGNSDLELAEVMEFTGNFYAEVHEKSTGIGAFELLVDRYSGEVYPEPGPNMMWNLKYGHMGGWGMMRRGEAPDAQMPVTPEQAIEQAQKYLDHVNNGLKAGKAEPFYGYYTLHTERDGKVTGMLSVNGHTGAVWYHAWHGDFVGMEEMEAE